jgi:hypothetical protein
MDEVEARFFVNLEIQKATNREIDYSKLMSTERLLARMIVDDAIHNYFDTFEISYDHYSVEDVKEAGFLVNKLRQARKILLED